MSYGDNGVVAYRVAHMQHKNRDPHVWLLVGSGPWFDNDPRGCWVVLHTWISDDKLITRIEDPENAPFAEADVLGERFLHRDEVMAKCGAAEWVVSRSDQFQIEHEATVKFILASSEAQQAVAADHPKTGAG